MKIRLSVTRLGLFLLPGILLSASACLPGLAPSGMRVIYDATICHSSEGVKVSLLNTEDYEPAWTRLQQHALPRPVAPEVDFEHYQVLLMEMGQQPSTGYGLALEDPQLKVVDGWLQLRVHWREPPADSVQAQVITSPCLLIQVPRRDYQGFAVYDRMGHLKIRQAVDR